MGGKSLVTLGVQTIASGAWILAAPIRLQNRIACVWPSKDVAKKQWDKPGELALCFGLRQLVSAAEAQDGEYVDQTLGSPFYAFKGLKVPYPGVRGKASPFVIARTNWTVTDYNNSCW